MKSLWNMLGSYSQVGFFRKTPVSESLFNKVAGLRPAFLSKMRLWHKFFPVNFNRKFLSPAILVKRDSDTGVLL